jgi:hypothetical protein
METLDVDKNQAIRGIQASAWNWSAVATDSVKNLKFHRKGLIVHVASRSLSISRETPARFRTPMDMRTSIEAGT